MDFTAKHWSPNRWQQVVDHFKDKLLFVQVGERGHQHPALDNVLDFRGMTDLRQLIRLVYHADGVACCVTSLMHLASGVTTKDGKLRPCVVVAGGRESPHWEAYPGHRFLDTIGMLPCCRNGGCWKSRVIPLDDGDPKNKSLCEMPTETDGTTIPKCLDLITARHVIEAIESYGVAPPMTPTNVSLVTRQSEPDTTPVTQRSPLPVVEAKGPVLYIWANHTYKGGHKIGDCITSAYAARLFAESDKWGRIILSRHPSHRMNFCYDQFIKDFDVQVIDENWPHPDVDDSECDGVVFPLCDERRTTREINGMKFDSYKELYRRVAGGGRQKMLCGEEKGLGRRNIFEYLFFGQEESTGNCPRGADFRPSAFGGTWEPSGPQRGVFLSPHAFSQSNDVFTLQFWSEVVRGLAARGIHVTVNTQNATWFGKGPFIDYYFQGDGDFRALSDMISRQRLSVSGNTGIAWMAAMNGVPLVVGEPEFFWYMDYRMRECGVPAHIFSQADAPLLVDRIEHLLCP